MYSTCIPVPAVHILVPRYIFYILQLSQNCVSQIFSKFVLFFIRKKFFDTGTHGTVQHFNMYVLNVTYNFKAAGMYDEKDAWSYKLI